ncbi:PspC domain-containing protein [Motilibacter deserti]|uniref:PspC domain-containing protein n=1 Tax=Motilibacter deserti TaxID=2714956 RepID=A0ABX0GWY6_9ACTN|nr:PspC domain-containing protein [Motilibacter deserti]NHC15461.1 PspC domain-containing protein [Motilibacter deserti]
MNSNGADETTVRFDKPGGAPPGGPGSGEAPPPPGGGPPPGPPPGPQPPPPGAQPPPSGGWFAGVPAVQALRRSTYDRKVAGVCGGLARSFGIDPLVLRVAVVVLTVFGGAGALLYGLAWLLLPEDGQHESLGERAARGRGDASLILPILVVVMGLSVFGAIGDGSVTAVVVVTLLALGAFVALRGDRPPAPVAGPQMPPPAYPPAYAPTGPLGPVGPTGPVGPMGPPPAADPYGRTAGTAYSPPPPPPPVTPVPSPPPDKPKEKSGPLTLLTISAAAVVAGLVTLVCRAAGEEADVPLVLGSALAVLGLGLVVAVKWGRAGGIVPVGVLLIVVLVLNGIADNPVRGGVGDRTWAPVTAEAAQAREYRLGMGNATLDLRGLALDGQRVDVEASLGVGELTVLVPDDVALEIDADVNAVGDLRLPGRPDDSGSDLSSTYADASGAGNGTLVLDLDVNVGSLEVRREAS